MRKAEYFDTVLGYFGLLNITVSYTHTPVYFHSTLAPINASLNVDEVLQLFSSTALW